MMRALTVTWPGLFMNASAAIADPLLRQACPQVLRRAGGRARRLVGHRIAANTAPSLAPPRARLTTRLPGAHCSSDCNGGARRTVLNSPGQGFSVQRRAWNFCPG